MKLTMTEAHSWDVPDEIIGGQPRRLARDPVEPEERSGNRQAARGEHQVGPPKEMMEAVKQAIAEKPSARSSTGP